MKISQKIEKLWESKPKQTDLPQYMTLEKQDLDDMFGENFSHCFNVRKRPHSSNLEVVFEEEGRLYFCIIRKGFHLGEFLMRYNSYGLFKKIDDQIIGVYKENKTYIIKVK